MARPSSVRTGTFCRFGSVEERRPVAATVWLKVVWIRPSAATVLIRPSTVERSRACSRWRSMITGSSCSVWPASQASASASVVYPVLVFLVFGRFSSPKKTSWSCLGEPRLNSWPTEACASFTACWTAPANCCSMASRCSRSAAMPCRSRRARRAEVGSSTSWRSSRAPTSPSRSSKAPPRSRTARAWAMRASASAVSSAPKASCPSEAAAGASSRPRYSIESASRAKERRPGLTR